MDKQKLEELKKCETVELIPTWKGIIRALIEAATNATTMEARNKAWEELYRLAEIADNVNGKFILTPEEFEKVKHLLNDKTV